MGESPFGQIQELITAPAPQGIKNQTHQSWQGDSGHLFTRVPGTAIHNQEETPQPSSFSHGRREASSCIYHDTFSEVTHQRTC